MAGEVTLRDAEGQGYQACRDGFPEHKNPFAGKERAAWYKGWRRAAATMPGFSGDSTLLQCSDGTCNCAAH